VRTACGSVNGKRNRAFSRSPDIVLFREPTSALGVPVPAQVIRRAAGLQTEPEVASVVVADDLASLGRSPEEVQHVSRRPRDGEMEDRRPHGSRGTTLGSRRDRARSRELEHY
jgi:hypothetical protein